MKRIVTLAFAFTSALLLAAETASAADAAPQNVTPPSAACIDSRIQSDGQNRPRPIYRRAFAGSHYRGDGCSRKEHHALMRECRRDHRSARYDRHRGDDRYDDDDRGHPCHHRYHAHYGWNDD